MGIGSGLYKVVLLLHILAVVVGIGGQLLDGVYGAKAKELGGATAGAVLKVNFEVSRLADRITYTIPVSGVLLVALSDGVWSMGQAWIWLALVLFVVAVGIVHGLMVPSSRKLQAAPADGAGAAGLEQRLAAGGMALSLLTVVLLALMIWKPGV